MRITVKLIAVVVPGSTNSTANKEVVVDLADGATPNDALAALDLPAEDAFVTLVNDESVPPGVRDRLSLKAGDTLTVFPPIKGG